MAAGDTPPDAEKLWAEMLDSVRSILDTVEGSVASEPYSDGLKNVLVESMHIALEGLKDLKDVASHLPPGKRLPAIEELNSSVERASNVMAALRGWAGV